MEKILTETELKNGYLVMHTREVEEGESSNYARYRLKWLLYFNSEKQREGFMAEADMYGNEEFNSGNHYEKMTLNDVYKEMEVRNYNELKKEVGWSFKMVDKTDTDYSEYLN